MPTIPNFLLKKLYEKGSLRVAHDGKHFNTHFKLKNNLASATIQSISVAIDGHAIAPQALHMTLRGLEANGGEVTHEEPFHFPYDSEVDCKVNDLHLGKGKHEISLRAGTQEIGDVAIDVDDVVE